MNATQRQPYLAAVEQWKREREAGRPNGWLALCAMCRYLRWGKAGGEGTVAVSCVHPLPAVPEQRFALAFRGGDCLGFRPTAAAREEIAYDGQYHAGGTD